MNEATIITAEELATLRKDAERYRYLRNRTGTMADGNPFICIFFGAFSAWTGEDADRKIDAALVTK